VCGHTPKGDVEGGRAHLMKEGPMTHLNEFLSLTWEVGTHSPMGAQIPRGK
jgi:hypothetical protein